MSWWNRFVSLLHREAADAKEGLDHVAETLDAELTRKERELAASPEERIDMIMEEQAAEDERFEDLTDRILGGEGTGEEAGEPTSSE
jgi:hypothetical protein